MHNPFEHIEERLDRMEALLLEVLERDKVSKAEPQKRIFSLNEVAEYLGLSKSCVYTYVSEKKIPVNKRGGKNYFLRDEIDTWVKEGRVKTVFELQQEAIDFINERKAKRK